MILTRIFKETLIILILICSNYLGFSQDNESECRVLLSEISDSYKGGCKNGLAHGKGAAKGIDSYEGKFKKGLPHGMGTYTWSNGDYYDGTWKYGKRHGNGLMYRSDSKEKIFGQWKEDEFIKEIELKPYEILQRIGISGCSFTEKYKAVQGSIEIVFSRDGKENKKVDDLIIDASSGFVKSSDRFTGIDNVSFPFEGKVQFTAVNRFNTGTINCEIKFKISKEGSWKVVIRY